MVLFELDKEPFEVPFCGGSVVFVDVKGGSISMTGGTYGGKVRG